MPLAGATEASTSAGGGTPAGLRPATSSSTRYTLGGRQRLDPVATTLLRRMADLGYSVSGGDDLGRALACDAVAGGAGGVASGIPGWQVTCDLRGGATGGRLWLALGLTGLARHAYAGVLSRRGPGASTAVPRPAGDPVVATVTVTALDTGG